MGVATGDAADIDATDGASAAGVPGSTGKASAMVVLGVVVFCCGRVGWVGDGVSEGLALVPALCRATCK